MGLCKVATAQLPGHWDLWVFCFLALEHVEKEANLVYYVLRKPTAACRGGWSPQSREIRAALVSET